MTTPRLTVRRELPRISLGTVYRNPQRLVDEGRMSLRLQRSHTK